MNWFEKIKFWYITGLWDAQKVQQAVIKNLITAVQAEEIINTNTQ